MAVVQAQPRRRIAVSHRNEDPPHMEMPSLEDAERKTPRSGLDDSVNSPASAFAQARPVSHDSGEREAKKHADDVLQRAMQLISQRDLLMRRMERMKQDR